MVTAALVKELREKTGAGMQKSFNRNRWRFRKSCRTFT